MHALISNRSWSIPDAISSKDHALTLAISVLILPQFDIEDHLRWNGSSDGILSLKTAYNFLLNQPTL